MTPLTTDDAAAAIAADVITPRRPGTLPSPIGPARPSLSGGAPVEIDAPAPVEIDVPAPRGRKAAADGVCDFN